MSRGDDIIREYIPANKYINKAVFGVQNICNLQVVTGTMANHQDMTSDMNAQ